MPVDGTYAIRFESVNHRARVWVDGKLEAEHKGEYLPFEARMFLTAGVRHSLVVRADWRGPAAMKKDGWHRLWFNFGGINRGVSIRRIGPSEISYPEMNTKLVDGDAVVAMKVHLRNNIDPRALGVTGTLTRGDRQIPISFPPSRSRRAAPRCSMRQVRIPKPDLWSPTAPNLWDLELEVPGECSYRARVGLREVRAEGTDLLLNGKPIRLRGASIHEDVFGRGDALRPVDQDRLIGHLKAIDANATRSQHPIDPGLAERLDAAGIMVWQGVGPTDAPGNWTSKGAKRVEVAKNRVRTSVRQAQLNPSIITWNLANEVAGNGHDDEQIGYIDDMAQEIKRTLDPSRPVALDIWGAHPPKETSKIYSHIDMIGWTNYIGWYESTNASADDHPLGDQGPACRAAFGVPAQGHRGDRVRRRGQRPQRHDLTRRIRVPGAPARHPSVDVRDDPEPRRRAHLEPPRLRGRAVVLRRLDQARGAGHHPRPRAQPEGPLRRALQGQAGRRGRQRPLRSASRPRSLRHAARRCGQGPAALTARRVRPRAAFTVSVSVAMS